MPLNLADIETLFRQHGGSQYSGEPVTQMEHALQTALLAEQAGADDELVTAALLHDLGHLLAAHNGTAPETPTLHGIDDLHQYIALPFLRGVFSERVLNAVRWHVDAKRYLCATRPDYLASLSADSQRSLGLQGGVFSADQASTFISQAGAEEAVALRLWDDLAKTGGLPTPTLQHYLQRAERCLL
ncbi:phosphonate degradation HD-domain oxygenase [Variovorax sp. HJSM1_2]|uniref:phosphonate degradation HD-domain oxygenase n=1 Tax=Variovorax sp. HJSM1_2 TaxID=3366263 RepID=UPI003BDC86E2